MRCPGEASAHTWPAHHGLEGARLHGDYTRDSRLGAGQRHHVRRHGQGRQQHRCRLPHDHGGLRPGSYSRRWRRTPDIDHRHQPAGLDDEDDHGPLPGTHHRNRRLHQQDRVHRVRRTWAADQGMTRPRREAAHGSDMRAQYGTFTTPNPSISAEERHAIREAMFAVSRSREERARSELRFEDEDS